MSTFFQNIAPKTRKQNVLKEHSETERLIILFQILSNSICKRGKKKKKKTKQRSEVRNK